MTRVKTALVVATTKHTAEEWLEPGAISPAAADPRAYLIVLKGPFICTRCSYPAGAKPPRGRWTQSIWVSGQGVSDFGLTQRVPGSLDKLGRVVKINLIAPAVTASDPAQAQQVTYHPCRRGHLSVRGTGARLVERHEPARDRNLVPSRCCRGARQPLRGDPSRPAIHISAIQLQRAGRATAARSTAALLRLQPSAPDVRVPRARILLKRHGFSPDPPRCSRAVGC